MFSAVIATGKHGELGKNGDMPWKRNLPSDLKFVKELTMGKSILMGANTFNSLPKLLPGRKHFVATFDINELDSKYDPNNENISIIFDLKQFLENNFYTENEFVIFGGASVYNLAIPYCCKVYFTRLDQGFNHCDTFFNYHFDQNKYTKTAIGSQSENGLSYTRYLYEKK